MTVPDVQYIEKWQGFGLIEFVLALSIIGLIGSLGARIIAVGWDTFAFHQDVLSKNMQVAFAFSQMGHFIGQMQTLLPAASHEKLVFLTQQGECVSYTLSPSHHIVQSIQFPPDGMTPPATPEPHPLVEKIGALSFQYLSEAQAAPLLLPQSTPPLNTRCIKVNLSTRHTTSSVNQHFTTTFCPASLRVRNQ